MPLLNLLSAGRSAPPTGQNAPSTQALSSFAGLRGVLLGSGVLLAALVYCYYQPILELTRIWRNSDDYSVGQLVPLTAVLLAWRERRALAAARRPCWWGLLLIAAGLAARLYGLLFLYESIERFSLVICIAGVVLTVAGAHAFWRLRWILLFLFLMLPLPARVHNMVAGPLQEQATTGAVFLLELCGVRADQQGNTMVLNDSVPLAVAEACSGLRMLTSFIMVAAAFALLVDRPRWQRAVLVLSSVPIAIVCNLVRLLATAVLYMLVDSATATTFFHDFAGVSMMPLAVAILLGEFWVMKALVSPPSPHGLPAGSRRRASPPLSHKR